jgi:hypothetical protein
MQRRTFAKALVGVLVAPAVVAPTVALPVPETQQPFRVLQVVGWLRPPTGMPTVGRVIGIQQRFVGHELEETRYHIDFETTKLWIGAHELRLL